MRRSYHQANTEKEAALAKAKAEAEAEAEAQKQEVAVAVKKAEELKACVAAELELKECNDEKQAEAKEQAEALAIKKADDLKASVSKQVQLKESEMSTKLKEPDEYVSKITTSRYQLRSNRHPPDKYTPEPKIAKSAVSKPKIILKRNTKLSTKKVEKVDSENTHSNTL